ncbi:hypothetical protein [Pontibacter arcticus]|nr:hypothetical protein [Pontibacter arcticus]
MLMTLEYTRSQNTIDQFVDSVAEKNLTYYASDLLTADACKSMAELGKAIRKATRVCKKLDLPLKENFKLVFRAQGSEVVQDWKLSPMAYMLLILNTDSKNEVVAQLQVEMVKRLLHQEDKTHA